MNRRRGAWRPGRAGAGLMPLLALLLLAPACALIGDAIAPFRAPALPAASPVAGAGMNPTDAWLRHHYLTGDPAAAVDLLEASSALRPRDDLLRDLLLATALHYTGDYEASDSLFASAEDRAELLSATSVTATAGALSLTERAHDFLPGPTERRMVRYYRIMNRLALSDLDGAMVEARRLGTDLQSVDPDDPSICELAVLDHLVGLVFEMGGERNDALVALRRADRAAHGCTGIDVVEDLSRVAVAVGASDLASVYPEPLGEGEAEIVLVIERGFAPALRPADLNLPIYRTERDRLQEEGSGALPELVGVLAGRAAWGFHERGSWHGPLDPAYRHAHRPGRPAHIVRVAWATLPPLTPAVYAPTRLFVGEHELAPASRGHLASALARDFQADQPVRLARAVGRSVVRYLATNEVERRLEERSETTAAVLGTLTNLTLNVVDQPDVRSWSTLPARIEVVRLVVPAGEPELAVRVDGRREALASVAVAEGRRAVVVHRVWEDPDTQRPRRR